MARRYTIGAWALLLAVAAVLPGATVEAKEKKKRGSAGIAGHPSQLRYGPLDFEVPDGAAYRHQLSNGIAVYIAEDHDLPLVDVSITVRGGSFLDPVGKPGVAELTGAMLRRGGTTSMSAEEFDERVDFLAVNIGSSMGDTSGGASLNCITGVLDEGLDLLFKMLRTPGFQGDRLQIEKDNLLEAMKQRNDSPASISRREWQWLMRGHDHFSSRVMTRAELDAVSRDDLIVFHLQYWRPENMIIAVAGDVEPAAILAKLEKRFAEWKVEDSRVPWPPPAPSYAPRPGLYYVEKDIPQGRVLIGHLGMQRSSWDDPEPFALMVMNDILGGRGFTSRLLKRIRSDEGLAYSAGSAFGVGEYWPGLFQVFYQSKSATVALAAKIALEEIDRIRSTPVSAEELKVAKNSFIDDFPRRFESAQQIAGTFAEDEYDRRSHDYWKSYRERVGAVTAEDVMAAAKKYLDPERLVYLVVGKWDEIQVGDPDGKASMAEIHGGKAQRLPLRDPLTLEPLPE